MRAKKDNILNTRTNVHTYIHMYLRVVWQLHMRQTSTQHFEEAEFNTTLLRSS